MALKVLNCVVKPWNSIEGFTLEKLALNDAVERHRTKQESRGLENEYIQEVLTRL